MTQEEFEQNYLGLIVPAKEVILDSDQTVFTNDVDWFLKDMSLKVKYQGNVVHVGHSPPLEHLKLSVRLKELFNHYLSNNLLIFQDHMEIKDVAADLWITPSNTSEIKVKL